MYTLYPVGETDNDKHSTPIYGSDNGSGATFDASTLGGFLEDGDDNCGGGSRSAPNKGRRGAAYCCRSEVCGQTVAAHPIFVAKTHNTPRPRPVPFGRAVLTQTNIVRR